MLNPDTEKHIPATIHAIWAGGGRRLPPIDGMSNLAKWAYLNPGFSIILWVDERTLPEGGDLATLIRTYKEEFIEAYQKLDRDSEPGAIAKLLDVKSIREAGVCAPYGEGDDVDYAIDRLDPNYGLSSDILRYRILYQYGGVYIDVTDVMPGMEAPNFLGKLPHANFGGGHERHQLYIDHLAQQATPSEALLADFSLPSFSTRDDVARERALAASTVGNDSFICTAGNPIMLELSQETRRRLRPTTLIERIAMAYGGFNIKDRTIDLSGPNVVKTILLDEERGELRRTSTDMFPLAYSKFDSYIFPLKQKDYQVTRPPAHVRNTCYWNDVGIDVGNARSIEEIYEKIMRVVIYEVNNMGILRLDDHFKTLAEAVKRLPVPPSAASSASSASSATVAGDAIYIGLLDQIATLPLEKVVVAQSISNNPLIASFYTRYGLASKTLLDTAASGALSDMLQIWEHVTSYGLFTGTSDYQPDVLQSITTARIETTLTPLEIRDVFHRLERGSTFMEKIIYDLDRYPLYKYLREKKPNFSSLYLHGMISKYFLVLDSHAEAFLRNGSSLQMLNQLSRQLINLSCHPKVMMPLPVKLQGLLDEYKSPGDIDRAFRRAAFENNLEDIKYLSTYADINSYGPTSRKTALHLAQEEGHEEVARWLMDFEADRSMEDSTGRTPDAYAHTP